VKSTYLTTFLPDIRQMFCEGSVRSLSASWQKDTNISIGVLKNFQLFISGEKTVIIMFSDRNNVVEQDYMSMHIYLFKINPLPYPK